MTSSLSKSEKANFWLTSPFVFSFWIPFISNSGSRRIRFEDGLGEGEGEREREDEEEIGEVEAKVCFVGSSSITK